MTSSSDWLKIVKDIIGCFNEIFLFYLSFLAVSMMLIVVNIASLISSFLNVSMTFGMTRWWIESWVYFPFYLTHFLMFWYMCSVRKGTIGLIKILTLSNTSKSTLILISIFSSSRSPFILVLLSLTYQLVKLSRNFTNGDTTLYNLYSYIYFLTCAIKVCKADSIQRSVTLNLGASSSIFSTKTNGLLDFVSSFIMFWIKNL